MFGAARAGMATVAGSLARRGGVMGGRRAWMSTRAVSGGVSAARERREASGGHQKPTAGSRHRIHSTLPEEEVDVVVVGCGSAGLLAGATLANAGLSVHCFDAHYVAGGCATQFGRTVKKGDHAGLYRFDVGLHYIGDVPEFERLLAPAGVSVAAVQNFGDFPVTLRRPDGGELFASEAAAQGADVVLEQMDPDCFDTLVFPDFDFPIPASVDLYRDRLVEMFPSEVKGIDRYVRLLKEVDAMQTAMASSSGKGVAGALGMAWKLATSGRLLAQWRDKALGDFLDTCTNNMQLRAVIAGQNGDYGLPPSEASVLIHCGLAMHYFRQGGFYPRGGGQAISDALATSIERNGGAVHLRRGVRRITVQDGEATGVELEPRGKEEAPVVKARVVISGADLAKTLTTMLAPEEVLEPSAAAEVVSKVDGFTNADGLFMTCLGLDETREGLQERGMRTANYWCFDDYDFEATYRDIRTGTAEDAFGCYITCASMKDPHVAHSPPGTSNVEVLTLCSSTPEHWGLTPEEAFGPGAKYRRNQAYLDMKARLQDGMIARLDKRFPALSDRIVFAESTTPFSHHRFTHGGTAYGLAATPEQFLANRPGLTGPVRRLLLCGHSTRSGHGIMGAMMGGSRAAKVAGKVLRGE